MNPLRQSDVWRRYRPIGICFPPALRSAGICLPVSSVSAGSFHDPLTSYCRFDALSNSLPIKPCASNMAAPPTGPPAINPATGSAARDGVSLSPVGQNPRWRALYDRKYPPGQTDLYLKVRGICISGIQFKAACDAVERQTLVQQITEIEAQSPLQGSDVQQPEYPPQSWIHIQKLPFPSCRLIRPLRISGRNPPENPVNPADHRFPPALDRCISDSPGHPAIFERVGCHRKLQATALPRRFARPPLSSFLRQRAALPCLDGRKSATPGLQVYVWRSVARCRNPTIDFALFHLQVESRKPGRIHAGRTSCPWLARRAGRIIQAQTFEPATDWAVAGYHRESECFPRPDGWTIPIQRLPSRRSATQVVQLQLSHSETLHIQFNPVQWHSIAFSGRGLQQTGPSRQIKEL